MEILYKKIMEWLVKIKRIFLRRENYLFFISEKNLDLFDVIQSDKYIMKNISLKKLKLIFSYSKHFKNVNFIFRRVFK